MDLNVLSRVESFYPLALPRGRSDDAFASDAASSSSLLKPPSDEAGAPPGEAGREEELKRRGGGPPPRHAPAPPSRRDRRHASLVELLLHNALKGAALGWGGCFVFRALFALQRRRPPRLALIASTDHARWAAFLAAFLALHNGCMRGLAPPHRLPPLPPAYDASAPPLPPQPLLLRGAHYRGALAGGVAGLSLLFAPPRARGYIALLLAVRAAEVAARHSAAKGLVPPFLARNGATALMMASSAPVLFCWLFSPASLDASYLRFLNRQSGKSVVEMRAVAAALDGSLPSKPRLVADLNAARLRGTRGSRSPMPQLLKLPPPAGTCAHCATLHGSTVSCSAHAVSYVASGVLRALPLYLPVHALPLVLFRSQKLRTAPLPLLRDASVSVARSSLWLSAYCGTGFISLCAISRLVAAARVAPKAWHALIAGALCGATLLLEKPSRRVELALYTLTQAIRCSPFPAKGGALREKWAALPVFVVASAVVSHHFVRHPATLRPSYRALLMRFLADSPGAGGSHRRLLS